MHKLILQNGGNGGHRHRLQTLLNEVDGPIRIATAYVTDTELLLRHAKDRHVQVLTSRSLMDIVSGASSLSALKTLLESGIQIRWLSDPPRFHAKVYIFGGDAAIVTSANLTQSAFDRNIEVGTELRGDTVRELIAWFKPHWKDARPVGKQELVILEEEAAPLRRDYFRLRRKAVPKLKSGTTPAVLSGSLRELLVNATTSRNGVQTFLCNTDRKNSPRTSSGDYESEELMRSTGYAAAWEEFKFPDHMAQAKRGDAILMYANKRGIIAVGEATGGHEISEANTAGQIRPYDEREWRVPVDWLFWDEGHPCPWKPHDIRTFVNVSSDKYRERRGMVREFLAR